MSSEPIVMENEGHERTEHCIRWSWHSGSVSYAMGGSSTDYLRALLEEEPPFGIARGELMQRTVTTTAWEPVPAAPAQQGLIAVLENDFDRIGVPADVARDFAVHDGLRYLAIGEEGESVVILGHPPREQVASFQQWFAKDNGFDLDEFVTDADETFCRQLHRCPTHEAKDGDCTWCMFISEGEPWLDWTTQDGEGLLSNSGKPGYFPVVVWEVGE